MMRLRCLSFIALIAICAVAAGAATREQIHRAIRQTYNFQPHTLDQAQLNLRSVSLDQFWSQAQADPADYIPALKNELADFSNPPFFLYDGSILLLKLSDTDENRKIALAAIARCDLRDVQKDAYFYQIHRLAVLNQDTTAAAFHVLEDPNYRVFIPQHVLWLGQDYILIYLLLPTSQNYWEQPAIERLSIEREPTAQKSLLLLLWYAQSTAADRAIAAYRDGPTNPPASREYAKELLTRKDDIPMWLRARAAFSSEASIRQERRERMRAVSDEALDDLDEYTAMLCAKRK